MKVLVVGGTGLTGATSALHLRAQGHEVTIMSRNKPQVSCLVDFPFVAGDYINDDVAVDSLRPYDWLVFAAGADIRLLPPDESEEDFFNRANVLAIPRFFSRAKEAGISRAVYVGTYYPQVVPEKIASSVYVRSRHLADEGVRALSSDSFCVCSINAPFILGQVPGLEIPHLGALVQYAAGRLEGVPLIAPAGGVNHISAQSMAEAIDSALNNGVCGTAYLVGDENISWKDYLEMFCEAAGNPQELAVTTDEHPMFPDIMMYAGRNAVVSYQSDYKELSYRRNDIAGTIASVVAAYL